MAVGARFTQGFISSESAGRTGDNANVPRGTRRDNEGRVAEEANGRLSRLQSALPPLGFVSRLLSLSQRHPTQGPITELDNGELVHCSWCARTRPHSHRCDERLNGRLAPPVSHRAPAAARSPGAEVGRAPGLKINSRRPRGGQSPNAPFGEWGRLNQQRCLPCVKCCVCVRARKWCRSMADFVRSGDKETRIAMFAKRMGNVFEIDSDNPM